MPAPEPPNPLRQVPPTGPSRLVPALVMRRLSPAFYERHAREVAPELVGKLLVRRLENTLLRGRIVEVEAYVGEADPGSHTFRGKTRRNSVMFGPPGRLYVYFTYGMHWCMNVVTDPDNVAGAVLLRAVEPLSGVEQMTQLRGLSEIRRLCNGPANLCKSFGITGDQNGLDLQGQHLWIEDSGAPSPQLRVTTRVGLREGAEMPLRFVADGSSFVSPGRPSRSAD
jgi:DNA-3-methyladenine glycosylase